MRHHARLSTAVPHNTAFFPPAFIAMLPPTQDASAEVGSTANTKPARSAASLTRLVTTPAAQNMLAVLGVFPGSANLSTGPTDSRVSVLMNARQAVTVT